MTVQELKCLFGFHTCEVPYVHDSRVLICKHCKRFGQSVERHGIDYYEFDSQGREIRRLGNNQYSFHQTYNILGVSCKREVFYREMLIYLIYYNKKGKEVYHKNMRDDAEQWFSKTYGWVKEKPKDWVIGEV